MRAAFQSESGGELAKNAAAHRIGVLASNIQIVAVDLDGTLLDQKKQVSKTTAAALACLPGQGVRVVIASARPPRSVRAIYAALKLETWQINYNGALIWDEPSRTVVHHEPMKPKLVLEMIERARDMFEEVAVSCEILDRWYTDHAEQEYMTETGRLFRPDVVAPIEEFCREPVTKMLLLGEPRIISRLEQLLIEEYPMASVVRSEPELLQIMSVKADKAVALHRVATHYGVSMENVMAIGDAANDIGMLKAAGVGVAMDNAHPMVKRIANWVAPSNNDHGVHAALRKYGLCP
jgi:Cof subfamily protein (haloacid dehalogenase superfamily)